MLNRLEGVVTLQHPAGIGGRTCFLGHCLRRGYTPASKALTPPAVDGALFLLTVEMTAGAVL
jgi:hypothetical protein